MSRKIWNSIGLMSGTSMDGIDAALIKTDGYQVLEEGPFLTLPYKTAFRKLLENLIAGKGDLNKVEDQLTLEHAKAVSALIENFNVAISDVDLIGFHGHTISHNPDEQHTLQIGNGRLLASTTGVDVVNDLRSSDVKAGGQGAPLAPIYHKALMKSQDKILDHSFSESKINESINYLESRAMQLTKHEKEELYSQYYQCLIKKMGG